MRPCATKSSPGPSPEPSDTSTVRYLTERTVGESNEEGTKEKTQNDSKNQEGYRSPSSTNATQTVASAFPKLDKRTSAIPGQIKAVTGMIEPEASTLPFGPEATNIRTRKKILSVGILRAFERICPPSPVLPTNASLPVPTEPVQR
ncbi:hypothetical protein Trydic_g9201 [Trypoxylus dichotomus]